MAVSRIFKQSNMLMGNVSVEYLIFNIDVKSVSVWNYSTFTLIKPVKEEPDIFKWNAFLYGSVLLYELA